MTLNLDILPHEQRRLWPLLKEVPDQFILYGGTALALQLGHRESIDFDFFTFQDIDTYDLLKTISFLKHCDVQQQTINTLTVLVGEEDRVQMSFFGVPKLYALEPPLIVDNDLKIASINDIAGTKIATIQARAEIKDYIDIDIILQKTDITLNKMLMNGRKLYGRTFNPENALKALCYFEDGNVNRLDNAIRQRLVKAVSKVDRKTILEIDDL